MVGNAYSSFISQLIGISWKVPSGNVREVRVIVELPGVEKKDIRLYGTDNSLTISVDTPQRKYYKEIQLLAGIDPKQARSTYKNGVLEITLPQKKEKPKVITIE